MKAYGLIRPSSNLFWRFIDDCGSYSLDKSSRNSIRSDFPRLSMGGLVISNRSCVVLSDFLIPKKDPLISLRYSGIKSRSDEYFKYSLLSSPAIFEVLEQESSSQNLRSFNQIPKTCRISCEDTQASSFCFPSQEGYLLDDFNYPGFVDFVSSFFVDRVYQAGLIGFDFIFICDLDEPFKHPLERPFKRPEIPDNLSPILHSGMNQLHLVRSLPTAQNLIRQGVNFNTPDDYLWTPLHRTGWSGKAEIAALFLENGADIHARDEDQRTPLHTAVFFANPDVVDVLLKFGADPNARDHQGMTPLHLASWAWKADRGWPQGLYVAKQLINYGADPNIQDLLGRTPVHEAASWAPQDFTMLLIDNGGDVNIRDVNDRTPFHDSIEFGEGPTPYTILERGIADVNARDKEGKTPLFLAEWVGMDQDGLIARGAIL